MQGNWVLPMKDQINRVAVHRYFKYLVYAQREMKIEVPAPVRPLL